MGLLGLCLFIYLFTYLFIYSFIHSVIYSGIFELYGVMSKRGSPWRKLMLEKLSMVLFVTLQWGLSCFEGTVLSAVIAA
jgi:hypothetical protein